ncbi:hypothetical protein G6F15_013529 [Rhizopus arrhizus]|nr:hypothetical protein G6F15_013529 [Rhizopus arrhizus]
MEYYDLNWETSVFQHDNEPKHRSKPTTQWMKDSVMVCIDDWPSQSPDPNPIEHVTLVQFFDPLYRGKEWNKGHRCEEFKEAKKSSNNAKAKEGFSLSRVNRMAIRSNTNEDSENDEDVTNGHLNRMALD